jgi:hypothetical protein
LRLASGRLEEKEGGELLPAGAEQANAVAVEDQSKHPVPAAAASAPSSSSDGGEPAKAG